VLRVKICCIASDAVAPYGLDLCHGVRSEGRFGRANLQAFFSSLPQVAA